MKPCTFTVTDRNDRVQTYESDEITLSVWDMRGKYEADSVFIHPSFFEQMTRAISPTITDKFGFKAANFELRCMLCYFIMQPDGFNMPMTLCESNSKEPHSCELWVHCYTPYDEEGFTRPMEGLQFHICDREEHLACERYMNNLSPHPHPFVAPTYTGLDALEFQLSLYETADTSALPESDYPDVMLKIYLKRKPSAKKRQEIFDTVEQFLLAWNNQDDITEYIHDWELYEQQPARGVCIYIDFAGCDPTPLQQLYFHLMDTVSGITNIEI